MKIEQWDIDRIKPYDKNVKNHDTVQVKKIAKSIEDFGWDQPIVVDGDGVIIKGHGRTLAAKHLGLKKVPVVVRSDLSPEAVKAARLADNRVAESGIDTAMLQEELASLEYDLAGIFDDKELAFLTADLGTMNEEAFMEDLEKAISEQSEETKDKLEEVGARDVGISKALGFNAIPGKDEKHISRFMAIVTDMYKLTPAESLVAFAKELVNEHKSSVT